MAILLQARCAVATGTLALYFSIATTGCGVSSKIDDRSHLNSHSTLGSAADASVNSITAADARQASPNCAALADPPVPTAYYDTDIAPIVSSSCVSCHAGGQAPDLRPNQLSRDVATAVGAAVAAARMPSGKALTPAQRAMFTAWTAGGYQQTKAAPSPAAAPATVPCSVSNDGPKLSCSDASKKAGYDLCHYDAVYAYRRMHLDLCGKSATADAVAAFSAATAEQQPQILDKEATACMATNYWRGKDGILWERAAVKIRPVPAIKAGEDGGTLPLADYYDDFNMVVYHQLDGADARGVMTADYFIKRTDGDQTTYQQVADVPLNPQSPGVMQTASAFFSGNQQLVAKDKRAGVLSTAWVGNGLTMFASVPRTTAAHFLRTYLGLDISKGQGLVPADASTPLVDYDSKGVTREACSGCHTTLDPLTYPFTRYNGLTFNILGMTISSSPTLVASVIAGKLALPSIIGDILASTNSLVIGGYDAGRITKLAKMNKDTEPNLAGTPEAGKIFGKPVSNLQEWGQVAANSDAFAQTIVRDYWTLLIGVAPGDSDQATFDDLAQKLKTTHNYSVEALVLDLIKRDIYGAP